MKRIFLILAVLTAPFIYVNATGPIIVLQGDKDIDVKYSMWIRSGIGGRERKRTFINVLAGATVLIDSSNLFCFKGDNLIVDEGWFRRIGMFSRGTGFVLPQIDSEHYASVRRMVLSAIGENSPNDSILCQKAKEEGVQYYTINNDTQGKAAQEFIQQSPITLTCKWIVRMIAAEMSEQIEALRNMGL
jgi:hypothetical protein